MSIMLLPPLRVTADVRQQQQRRQRSAAQRSCLRASGRTLRTREGICIACAFEAGMGAAADMAQRENCGEGSGRVSRNE